MLILGYSCSDYFDITPQIQNISGSKKEVVCVSHIENDTIKIMDEKIDEAGHLFGEFQGFLIETSTESLVKRIWEYYMSHIGEYEENIPVEVNWKSNINYWKQTINRTKGLNFFIIGILLSDMSDFKKAIYYIGKALKEAKNYRGVTWACNVARGNAYRYLGETKKAIKYHKKALEIAKSLGDKISLSSSYLNLGNDFDILGNYKREIECYNESLKIAKDNLSLNITKERDDKDLKELIVSCYINLGIVHDYLGNRKVALECFNNSIAVAEEIGDVRGIANCYMSLGSMYYLEDNIDKSEDYYNKSLKYAKILDDKTTLSRCYLNLGNICETRGDFEKRDEYYEKAISIANEVEDVQMISNYNANLGNLYSSSNINNALIYDKNALNIAMGMRDKRTITLCYMNIGSDYFILRDSSKAIEYYQKALEYATEVGNKRLIAMCYYNLGCVNHYLGNKNIALENFTISSNMFKELNDINKYNKALFVISSLSSVKLPVDSRTMSST